MYRISKNEREIFRFVHTKISEAITLVLKHGAVTQEAQALFWQARDQARLELPDEIKEYTQKLFDKMHKA